MKTESKQWEQRRWQQLLTALVIMTLFAGFIYIAGRVYISLNQDRGKIDAQRLVSSMIEGNQLPWSSEDSQTLAVLECDETIFINSEIQRIGFWANGCEYHLASDVEVVLTSKLFVPEGQIRFKPIE